MAFVNAAYVDLGKVWGYDPNTRNAQGFYDNAWVWGDVAPQGTDFLPCSYFYVVGQKDNLGFTPTSIDFNTASGLLSVQGTQEGVERIFLRNYMVGAPAPRFLNVRVNQRSRRLADLPVVAIITDNDETLPNIRGHLGMLDEEEGEVAEAETFGAEFGAEDDYEKAQRIMKLLRVVMRKATGPNARYAKTYAINAENSYYDYGFRGLKAQVAYVLSNLGGWRGDEAKQVKAELRKLIK